MKWVIQVRSGDFVGSVGFTEYCSEALLFDTEKSAIQASYRWLGAKVIRVENYFSGYEAQDLLEHQNFISHIAGAK